jgi:drug/metabolite transporter (DMT)-like permease
MPLGENPDQTVYHYTNLPNSLIELGTDEVAFMTIKFPANTKNIAIAFATVYILWGSTYLAIKLAIDTIPPLTMIATRFLIAGGGLYAALILAGAKHPKPQHWLYATILGFLLLSCGNCGVVLAERTVSTGMVSLLVAMVPVYIALLEHFGKSLPSARKLLGLVLGTIGVIVLIGPANLLGHGTIDIIGVATVMAGSFCWSLGSIISRTAPKPQSMLLATAMQMICGGAVIALVAFFTGEAAHFNAQAVSLTSLLAFFYLIIFGSIFGFTAYLWLLENVSPSKVSTYAYVNPIVAVFLGCAFIGESITPQTMLAAAIILSAVWLITSGKSPVSLKAKVTVKLPAPECDACIQPAPIVATAEPELQLANSRTNEKPGR